MQQREMSPSVNYRECWNCKEDMPESDTLLDSRGQPMLMDPDHPGLEHWKVCPAKIQASKIQETLRNYEEKHPQLQASKQHQQQQEQMTFNKDTYVIPRSEEKPRTDKKTMDDYILEKFDQTCNTLIENQSVFSRSIANQLQIISNQLASLAANQRSIMRQVGIPDT